MPRTQRNPVDLIIDASSIINLDNAEVLAPAVGLQGRNFCVSPLVIGECDPQCAASLAMLRQSGGLRFVDPEEISAELFLDLLERYELGEGETECLALALVSPYVFCCDDNKARNVGVQLIGQDRVVGSLRILKWMVACDLVSSQEAFALYLAMKEFGGYLPVMAQGWFERD